MLFFIERSSAGAMRPLRRWLGGISGALVFAGTVWGQGEGVRLKVGEVAPVLRVDEWLGGGAGLTQEEWKGKVLVIDFWATWCAPCVASIPHLNRLAAEFADEPVVFLAVTDDPPEKLKPFLERNPIKARIGIDRTRVNWPTFDIVSIPHGVVIGRDGKVAAITDPKEITAESVRRLLKGESAELPVKVGRPANVDWDEEWIEWKDGVRPDAYMLIKPIQTTTAVSSLRPGGNRLAADGVPVSVLVAMAYGTDPLHLDLRLARSSQTYRIAGRVPPERQATLLPWFQQTLAATFGIDARWESQERDVFVLSRVPGGAVPPQSVAVGSEAASMRGTSN